MGGGVARQYFFYLRVFFATELNKANKILGESRGRGVCILRTGSN